MLSANARKHVRAISLNLLKPGFFFLFWTSILRTWIYVPHANIRSVVVVHVTWNTCILIFLLELYAPDIQPWFDTFIYQI